MLTLTTLVFSHPYVAEEIQAKYKVTTSPPLEGCT